MEIILNGLLSLPWWGYLLYLFVVTHITIASVTIFLHRHQAHRALELHPIISHFFRFWLWFTTGMFTKSWVGVHRKHHLGVDTQDDPHSPQIYGIRKVLWQGAELYRSAGKDQKMIAQYGRGTPDDFIERNLYGKHSLIGILMHLALDVILFGPIGMTIWAVQMAWIPLTAAGVINGVGHYAGYRNFTTKDCSRNIVPLGVLIGGEELHNNHHQYPHSAKLSYRWYEFDVGWMYIRILEMFGLAKVRFVGREKVG